MKVTVAVSLALLGMVAQAGCRPKSLSAPDIDLAGSWHGTFTIPSAVPMSWTSTSSGTAFSGPLTIMIGGGFAGTMTLTRDNGQFKVKMDVPAGGIPGAPLCTMSATGTSDAATSSQISADLIVTFAQACVPTIAPSQTGTGRLSLTR